MKKINEAFICSNCKKQIPEASKTCRNHCPHCFVSVHVDGEMPGDRSSTCEGIMYPIQYEYKASGAKILFQCTICNKKHRNKRADDDEIELLPSLIQEYKKKLY